MWTQLKKLKDNPFNDRKGKKKILKVLANGMQQIIKKDDAAWPSRFYPKDEKMVQHPQISKRNISYK